MLSPQRSGLRAVLAFVVAVVLICLAIAFVDRPASTWSYQHLHRPYAMDRLTHLVDPLQPLAIAGLAVVTLAVLLGGYVPGKAGQAVLAASLAILVSVAIKEQLKSFFGRTWPETWVNDNPSWIRDHVFSFNLMHGGQGWASFPSGHTTQMAALATVLWLTYPRLRWLGVLLVAAVVIGLWGSDYHWVGDILAGGTLGVCCGVGMVGLVCRTGRPQA